MTWIIHPYLGLPHTVRAFMIVVVAGLGSMLPVLARGAGWALPRTMPASCSAPNTRQPSSMPCWWRSW